MKKTTIALTLCVAMLGLASAAMAGEVKMILATGGTAGTYYPFGGAMAKIWNSKIPGMNVTAQATGASIENIRLMNKDEVELALVQSDNIDWAFFGKEVFKEKITKMAAIAVLYPEIVHIVVRGDSPAKTFGDLKGLKVGVGAPGSGTEANFRQLHGSLRHEEGRREGAVSLLRRECRAVQGQAHRLPSSSPRASPTRPSWTWPTRARSSIVSIEDAMVTKITQKYPFLAPAKIPANTYKGQTEEVKTIAVMAVLIASPKRERGGGLQHHQGADRESARAGLRPCKGEGAEPSGGGQGRLHPVPPRRREVLQGKGRSEVGAKCTRPGRVVLPGFVLLYGMRYWIGIGVLLAAALAAVCFYPQRLVLEIANANTGQVVLCADMAEGEEFVLSFVHSVNKRPVYRYPAGGERSSGDRQVSLRRLRRRHAGDIHRAGNIPRRRGWLAGVDDQPPSSRGDRPRRTGGQPHAAPERSRNPLGGPG